MTSRDNAAGATDAGRIVFRPTSGIVFTLIAWAGCAAVAVTSIVSGAGVAPVVYASVAAFIVWLLLWRPSVVCFDDRVEFRNLVRDVTIPYALIDDVDTRFALAVEADGGRYSAWGAPAPGKRQAAGFRRGVDHSADLPRALREQGSVRPGDLTATASGAPATVVRRALDERARRGDVARTGRVDVRWNIPLIAATAVAAIAVAIAAIL